jgi:hypothetical protein
VAKFDTVKICQVIKKAYTRGLHLWRRATRLSRIETLTHRIVCLNILRLSEKSDTLARRGVDRNCEMSIAHPTWAKHTNTNEYTMYPWGMYCIGIRFDCCCIGATMGLGGMPAGTTNAEKIRKKDTRKMKNANELVSHADEYVEKSMSQLCAARIIPFLEPEPLTRLPPCCALLCHSKNRTTTLAATHVGVRDDTREQAAGKKKHDASQEHRSSGHVRARGEAFTAPCEGRGGGGGGLAATEHK